MRGVPHPRQARRPSSCRPFSSCRPWWCLAPDVPVLDGYTHWKHVVAYMLGQQSFLQLSSGDPPCLFIMAPARPARSAGLAGPPEHLAPQEIRLALNFLALNFLKNSPRISPLGGPAKSVHWSPKAAVAHSFPYHRMYKSFFQLSSLVVSCTLRTTLDGYTHWKHVVAYMLGQQSFFQLS